MSRGRPDPPPAAHLPLHLPVRGLSGLPVAVVERVSGISHVPGIPHVPGISRVSMISAPPHLSRPKVPSVPGISAIPAISAGAALVGRAIPPCVSLAVREGLPAGRTGKSP